MSDENVIIYKARDGRTEIALTKISDKVWLSQSDIANFLGPLFPTSACTLKTY